MPTILASAIIGKAQVLAQDSTAIRWPLSEWLGWLNDGQREVAIIRPSAYSKIASVPLVAGTRQALPADGVQFLEFIRNMGVGGAIPGQSARKVTRRLMDSQTPNWHSQTASVVVQHYIFDPLSPKTFYVYPPSTGTTQVEVMYEASPPDVATLGGVISLDDVYSNVLLDYLMYRAYSKDSEFIGNAERAVLYRKAFENSLGLKTQADAASVAASNERG